MANRRIERARIINKRARLKKMGKLTEVQISSDRHKERPFVDYIGVQSGYIKHSRAEASKYQGAVRYGTHTGNRIYRGKSGRIYVARDLLDTYFLTTFKLHRYTQEEIVAMGKPDDSGWRISEASPLGEVIEKLRKLQDGEPEKWFHISIRKASHEHIDLFFSPKKDRWFYLRLNPLTGLVHRSDIYGSKEVAEFKRLNVHQKGPRKGSSLLDWKEVTDPSKPLEF